MAVVPMRGELFNVSGEKLAIVEKILKKDKKKVAEQLAPPERIKMSFYRAQEQLQLKRKNFLRERFIDNTMREIHKVTILGDEMKIRREIILGFPVNSRDHTTGRTILHDAVAAQHISMVRMLCMEFRTDPNIQTFMGLETALHLAVITDSRQICVTLILNGADPNAVNKQGCTPLFYVRSKKVLKVLLRAGCDPLILNKKGENALTYLRNNMPSDAWEFGMEDILVKAIDSMKIRKYKEGKGCYEDDDGLSSINSAARSKISSNIPLIASTVPATEIAGKSNMLENGRSQTAPNSKLLPKNSS